MSDRGMKKWAPYRSLPEKDIYDNKMKNKRLKIEKPLVSNEEAERINSILTNHNNQNLIFTIFIDGTLQNIEGIIKRIDTANRVIILKDKTKINLKEIIDIKIAS